MYDIEIYNTRTNRQPYIDWENGLDRCVRTRVDARLTRIRLTGNLGDFKSVGNGVYELRLDFGPGYRVYFGLDKAHKQLVILLTGGSKGSQTKDIAKAQEYWKDHLSRK